MSKKGHSPDLSESRFSGAFGEGNDTIIDKIIPHRGEFQNTLQRLLSDYAEENSDKRELTAVEGESGTGMTTNQILQANDRYKVVAIEKENKELEERIETLDPSKERIELVKADLLTALSAMKPESADVFATAYTTHSMKHLYRQDVFGMISRVLKRGGLFINADKLAQNDPDRHAVDLEKQIHNFDVLDTIGHSELKRGWIGHYLEDERNKFTESAQIFLLKKNGFMEIQTIYRKRMEAIISAIKK